MSAAPPHNTFPRNVAAACIGVAIGATASAGNALLLYTGQGFLRAAGLLFSSTILALAAGVWAGSPETHDVAPRSRGRWLSHALALLVGGAFAVAWNMREELRALPLGGAAAVLLILALPAYTAGAVLAALHARHSVARGAGTAPAALGGAALGVLVTTTLLIQSLQPHSIYYSAAFLMMLIGLAESRARPLRTGASTMNGRVAIVTGVGGRGQLGFALAQKLLDAGARVIISGSTAHVEELATELNPAAHVAAVRADLLNDDDVSNLIAAARQKFGRIDALLNVAGGLSVIAPIADTTPELWQREVQRNAETVLRMSRAALPSLRESHGAIVNFAAPAGFRASASLGAYSAAKAAVIALTRALAIEEKGYGVRVNAIAPGLMDTAQNVGAGSSEAVFVPRSAVAAVAVFLTGPGAAGITGETIHVLGPTIE